MGLHDHLLAREQAVCDEFAGSQGDLRLSMIAMGVRKVEVMVRNGLQTAEVDEVHRIVQNLLGVRQDFVSLGALAASGRGNLSGSSSRPAPRLLGMRKIRELV